MKAAPSIPQSPSIKTKSGPRRSCLLLPLASPTSCLLQPHPHAKTLLFQSEMCSHCIMQRSKAPTEIMYLSSLEKQTCQPKPANPTVNTRLQGIGVRA